MTLTRKQLLSVAPAAALLFVAVAVVGLSVAGAARGAVAPTQATPVASEVAPATSTRDWQEVAVSRSQVRFR